MTDKKMRHLSRLELLELLIASERENETLRAQLLAQEERLQSRKIMIANSGSIAEACIQVNQVFEAAQAAADQYLENVKQMNGEQYESAEQIMREAQEKADDLIARTLRKCAQMEAEAEQAAEEKWAAIKERLEKIRPYGAAGCRDEQVFA